jgi:hypothetical protein
MGCEPWLAAKGGHAHTKRVRTTSWIRSALTVHFAGLCAAAAGAAVRAAATGDRRQQRRRRGRRRRAVQPSRAQQQPRPRAILLQPWPGARDGRRGALGPGVRQPRNPCAAGAFATASGYSGVVSGASTRSPPTRGLVRAHLTPAPCATAKTPRSPTRPSFQLASERGLGARLLPGLPVIEAEVRSRSPPLLRGLEGRI